MFFEKSVVQRVQHGRNWSAGVREYWSQLEKVERWTIPTLWGVFDRYSVTTLDSIGDLHFRSVTRSVTDSYIRYKKQDRFVE